jgi:hypothetical protein
VCPLKLLEVSCCEPAKNGGTIGTIGTIAPKMGGWGNAIESISHHHVGVIPSPFTAAALQDEEFGGAVIHLAAGGPVKK